MLYEQEIAQYLTLGFALHWLHQKSKAPKIQGWSTAPVANIEELRRTWVPGDNLGCRAGQWSRIEEDCGLVVLDIDLRTEAATNACYKLRIDTLNRKALANQS
jgi:Bifunctional DNA primase/polymerase, N-terminal